MQMKTVHWPWLVKMKDIGVGFFPRPALLI